ncbi:MAG: FkbM family methyltransferase [Pseudomonadota bacterium]
MSELNKLRRSIGRWYRARKRGPSQRWGRDFVSEYALRVRSNPETVLDVGGHIGETALLYSDYFPSATVYTFEPTVENQRKMDVVLAGKPEVLRVRSAVGNVEGSVRFAYNSDHPSMSRISDDPSNGYEVPVTTLDNFVKRENISKIDILKIDTEGNELSVLEGSSKILNDGIAEVVILEAGMVPNDKIHVDYWDIHAVLFGHKYRIFGFYEQFEDVFDPKPSLRRCDVAFVSPKLLN